MIFEPVDCTKPEVMELLKGAPLFHKHGRVVARKAVAGEQVATVLTDGTEETVNNAEAGDYIVTYQTGEQDILHPDTFFNRYNATNETGSYEAIGYCKAIKNPFGKSIEIVAPWGQIERDDVDCMIVVGCDEHGDKMDKEPYLVAHSSFARTYELAH